MKKKMKNKKGIGFLILTGILSALVMPGRLSGQIGWLKQTIDGNFDGARAVYSIDLDGDGDIDVLGAAYNADDITWWENDGNENFTKHTIADNFDGATSVFAIDLDDDDDIDVLGAAYNADDITWWENDGNENFTEHTIKGNLDGAHSVFAKDINGDGDIDVIGAGQLAGDVLWWESDGNQPPSFTEHVIVDNLTNAYDVYAADLDNDNDTDVVVVVYSSVGVDNVTWWENTNGAGTNWTKHLICDGYYQATSVFATDLDNDADNDILAMAGSGSPISWWKNDGSGNFAQDTISIAIGSRTDACVLDVDNDADLDIVSTGTYIVDWFENDGDENFTRHLIAQALSQVKSVFAVDLDGDTDIDILSAIENEDDIVWWRNSLVSMHNVGPVSIDVPSTVPFDTTIFPHATVKNFGLSTETFNAVCSIAPGGYLSTTVCNLAPAESIRVTFADPFTFAEGGAYTITVYTTLASDEWSGNDTLSKIVEVPIVLDAGAVSINIPAMVPLDTALYPEAVVKNFGSVASTFPVTCRIQPGGYLKTQTVQNLAPGVSTPVIFLNQFTFNEAAVCTVTVYTRLTDDGDPANDTLTKLVVVHDPGIAEGNTGIPGSFAFRAPTVCRGSNEIMLALPVAARVDLAVYDALGRRSKTLVNGMFGAGTYHIPARLDLSSGIYFYHLKTTSGENVVRKFLIVE